MIPLVRRVLLSVFIVGFMATTAGCSQVGTNLGSLLTGGRTLVYPPYEGGELNERESTEKERLLARSDFSVEIVQLTDDRRPRSMVAEPREGVIYEYEPDQLLSGISYRLPVLFNKHLAYRPLALKHYKVELRVRKLKTLIATGSFISGSFGRYQVDLEVEALARRPDSRVAIQRVYKVALEQPRRSVTGRSPSKEFDRAQMFDLTEDAIRRVSEQLAWDIRMTDARRWRIKPEPMMPARLHRVTSDAPQDAPGAPASMPAAEPRVQQPIILPPDEPLPGDGPVFIPPLDESGRS